MATDEILYRWIYFSEPCVSAAELDSVVADIVEKSLVRNHGLDVTGALVCTGSRFLQCLEGKVGSVRLLQASIRHDRRHRSVTDLLEEEGRQRIFADWSLLHATSSRYLNDLLAGLVPGERKQNQINRDAILQLVVGLSHQARSR